MFYVGMWLILISISSAQIMSATPYTGLNCEPLAKEYQRNVPQNYSVQLVWIQPLKDNGAFDLGEFNAHIINKVWDTTNTYYFDPSTNERYNSIEEVMANYNSREQRKAVIYNVNEVHPPFALWWHY